MLYGLLVYLNAILSRNSYFGLDGYVAGENQVNQAQHYSPLEVILIPDDARLKFLRGDEVRDSRLSTYNITAGHSLSPHYHFCGR